VSTLVAFNTVERLLRGDFFHVVDVAEVSAELASFPASSRVLGLGTTNWLGRHGELLVDGTARAPRFWWADPEGEPPAVFVEVPPAAEGVVGTFPFIAVAVLDAEARAHEWVLDEGADVHASIAQSCVDANIGLAALRVDGALDDVDYQVMCHIPVGGIADERPARAEQHHAGGQAWEALGVYAANPTIQSIVSHGVAAVHLHGRAGTPARGGHLNRATASSATRVSAWPLADLVMRIHNLDVAVR
jgi:predicted DNA-binding protein with PD1-like motif